MIPRYLKEEVCEPPKFDQVWSVAVMRVVMSGDVRRLVAALRSDRTLDPPDEYVVRHTIADLLDPACKRKRGRPTRSVRPKGEITLLQAENYVRDFKRIYRRIYKRSHGVERRAIERASKRFGVPEDQLYNRIHRGRNR